MYILEDKCHPLEQLYFAKVHKEMFKSNKIIFEFGVFSVEIQFVKFNLGVTQLTWVYLRPIDLQPFDGLKKAKTKTFKVKI